MKNKAMIITSAILFAILILFTGLILMDLKSNNSESKINVEISNWNIEHVEYGYLFSINMNAEEVAKLSDEKYDIYFLDKDSNLIYLIDNVSIDSNESGNKIFNSQIMFDISSLNKVVVANSGNKVSYNKNLVNSIKYVGITTETSTTPKVITTTTIKEVKKIQMDD